MNPRFLKLLRNRAPRRGMALLLVLAAVVLVSLLTVAFLLSMNHELISSKSYASGSSARVFADSAVNLVIGQLQAGTTQDNTALTWVSQPGLVRTYGTDGKMVNAYKLYSSNKMVESSTFAPLDASGNPADVPSWTAATTSSALPWVQYPNVYADLNSPITVNSVTKYPILDPGGLNTATQIEGFSVASQISGNSALTNQIPMPVTWLYILTDGRIATPSATSTDSSSVTLTTTDGLPVTANNPPVARVAFWSDDNTCRLNINTASEGSCWQIPFDEVSGDAIMTRGQPYTHEYQRYPGHPATTCLSPVFDYLATSSGTVNTTDMRNFIFSLTPYISGRGSQFGGRTIGYGSPIVLDNDRLYPSVDELLFLPKVNTSTNSRYTTGSANIQSIDNALADTAQHLDANYTSTVLTSTVHTSYSFATTMSLNPQNLEYARFFLTTDSRAPEINLFGQPRISLWPIDTRADHQSTWDKMLALSTSTGSFAYYFQRQDPTSPTVDANISRNVSLLAYLNHLTSTAIPGYGGTFATKYPSTDWAQVETSIFDWIRTVNLAYPDMTGTVTPYAWSTNSGAPSTGLGTTYPPGKPGSGQVIPIKIGSTQGYGRFPTLSKGAFSIMRESEQTTPSGTINYRVVFLMETYVPMLGYAGYIPDYHIKVSGLASAFKLVTSGTSSGTTSQTVNLQDGDIHVTAPSNFEGFAGRAWGGTQGYNNLFLYSDKSNNYALTARTVGSTDADTGYPFVSGTLTVSCTGSDVATMKAGLSPTAGGTANVTVTFLDSSDSTTIATYTLPFSSFGPLNGAYVSVTGTNVSTATSTGTGTSNTPPDLQSRLAQMVTTAGLTSCNVAWPFYKNAISMADIVRGVELNHGDLRISAITGTDANSQFVAHAKYNDTTRPHADSLLNSGGNGYAIDAGYNVSNLSGSITVTRGTLAGADSNFNPASTKPVGTPGGYLPQAPSAMSKASSPPGYGTGAGDFSNGLACEGDGPHIMKADEGNTGFNGESWGQSQAYPYQNQYFPYDAKLAASFSPNREVQSAVQLGTLPSQPMTPKPWQTLMFHPDYTGTLTGSKSPNDSLLLDLFWMPVVDPYPISEEYSTAGKVNMNYQIVPFTYINRSTAMIGALRSVKVGALLPYQTGDYKHAAWDITKDGNGFSISSLYSVDPTKTLLFFADRFSKTDPSNNVFKSATEICSIPLVPMNSASNMVNTGYATLNQTTANGAQTLNLATVTDAATLKTQMQAFWALNTLTGDNTLEAPYNSLYPRLTTQSNTYTVYVRAQALQMTSAASAGAGVFTNIANRISGEYRGSYEVERYLDLNDASIPDFTLSTNYNKTIYPYYKFRILSYKQFLP